MKQETIATAIIVFLTVLFFGLISMVVTDNSLGVKIACGVMCVGLAILMFVVYQIGYGSDDVA